MYCRGIAPQEIARAADNKDLHRENEEEGRRLGPRGWEGGTWASTDNKRIWALAGKRPYKWNLVLNLFSTELPFTRGSFTASVRDHNLREASHLYYEGKE